MQMSPFGFLPVVWNVVCTARVDRCFFVFTFSLISTCSSGLMFHVKTVSALTRAGADIPFKLCSQRLRSTLTSTSVSQDNVSSRGAHRDSARSDCTGQPGRGGEDGTTTPANEISVDFEQTQEAYKSKDSLELLRSLVVFKLCSFDFLVDKNKEVMKCYLTVQTGH